MEDIYKAEKIGTTWWVVTPEPQFDGQTLISDHASEAAANRAAHNLNLAFQEGKLAGEIHLPKSVKDVSPLAGLLNLKKLDAYHSSVIDFTPFDGRIGLTIYVDMKRVVELRKRQAV